MQYTLQVLTISGSKVLRQWKDTDRKITFCYNEARDNSKFIQSIEQCCHSLYLDDPVMFEYFRVPLSKSTHPSVSLSSPPFPIYSR